MIDNYKTLEDVVRDSYTGVVWSHKNKKSSQESKATDNRRNGSYPKKVTSNMGEIELNVPRDRKGEYEPNLTEDMRQKTPVIADIYLLHISYFDTPNIENGATHYWESSTYLLRSVNFYFTDVSEPSHISFARSVFILPTSQNRHSSPFSEAKIVILSYIYIIEDFK